MEPTYSSGKSVEFHCITRSYIRKQNSSLLAVSELMYKDGVAKIDAIMK
jgi:hypothetical protein